MTEEEQIKIVKALKSSFPLFAKTCLKIVDNQR